MRAHMHHGVGAWRRAAARARRRAVHGAAAASDRDRRRGGRLSGRDPAAARPAHCRIAPRGSGRRRRGHRDRPRARPRRVIDASRDFGRELGEQSAIVVQRKRSIVGAALRPPRAAPRGVCGASLTRVARFGEIVEQRDDAGRHVEADGVGRCGRRRPDNPASARAIALSRAALRCKRASAAIRSATMATRSGSGRLA